MRPQSGTALVSLACAARVETVAAAGTKHHRNGARAAAKEGETLHRDLVGAGHDASVRTLHATLDPALRLSPSSRCFPATARADEARLVILHTTDLHGALTAYDYIADAPRARGW